MCGNSKTGGVQFRAGASESVGAVIPRAILGEQALETGQGN